MGSSQRHSLADEEYDGKDYQADSKIKDEGPLKDRKCTDLFFWFVFMAALVAYAFTSKFAWDNGHPRQLITPVDGDGKLCGLSKGYETYPFLYYILTKDSKEARAVCVMECPTEIGQSIDCRVTTRMTSQDTCRKELSANGTGHIGYGTNTILERFCLPDADNLPESFDVDAYDNLIGEFGIDDV